MEFVAQPIPQDDGEHGGAQPTFHGSQARLTAAISMAKLGTFEWNVRADTVMLDERSREIFAFAPGEGARAKEVFDRIHPDDVGRVAAEVQFSRDQLTRLETEYRIVLPDGRLRTVASINNVVQGADGRAERIFGVVSDITERKQAEAAVRQSEEQLRRAIEIDTVGVIFFDLEGNIRRANDAFLRMSGYTREDLARSPLRWDTMTPAEWMPVSLERRDQLAATGRATPYEKQYIRKDGSRWWGLFAPRMLTEREAVEFIIDITERKQAEEALRESEERFRRAFAHAPVGLVLSSAEGELQHVNSAYCDIVGYTAEELRTRNFLSLTYPDDIAKNRELHAQLVSGVIPSFVLEKRYIHRDGHLVWVRATATVMREEAGRLTQVVGIVENIQDRKEAETALLQSREELDQFAHTVAHDLQAPLRSVRSYSELLAREYAGKLDTTAEEFLQFIVEGARGMERLIRALLRYAEEGEGSMERKPVRLEGVIDGVRALMQQELEEAGAEIIYGDLPVVAGDRVQLTQLFQNLIGNAIKYRKANEPPRVTISAEPLRSGCLVSVQDNGQGIAPRHAETIFQPLKRLHGKEVPGCGIGLAICKKIVERYGGRIWVESEPNKGSKFCFTMPYI